MAVEEQSRKLAVPVFLSLLICGDGEFIRLQSPCVHAVPTTVEIHLPAPGVTDQRVKFDLVTELQDGRKNRQRLARFRLGRSINATNPLDSFTGRLAISKDGHNGMIPLDEGTVAGRDFRQLADQRDVSKWRGR